MRGVGRHIQRNAYGILALIVALSVGTAWASSLPNNSVRSKTIKNGQVKTPDLAGNAVKGSKVASGSLRGSDLGADTLGGTQINEGSLNQGCKYADGAAVTIDDSLDELCFSGGISTLNDCWGCANIDCQTNGLKLPTAAEIELLAYYVTIHNQTVSQTAWIDGLYSTTDPFTATVSNIGNLSYDHAARNTGLGEHVCVYHTGVG